MEGLSNKLWAVKLELKKIRKASKGFKFKYTNLPDVEKNLRPLLVEHKLGYRFRTTYEEYGNILELIIFDKDNKDYEEKHNMLIPKGVQLAGMNEYQSLGSGLTYFRRYLLVTAFGVITDDDVDAQQPTAVKVVEVNHVAKIKQLIEIGRAKATLEKYYTTYSAKMTDADKKEIMQLISKVK